MSQWLTLAHISFHSTVVLYPFDPHHYFKPRGGFSMGTINSFKFLIVIDFVHTVKILHFKILPSKFSL